MIFTLVTLMLSFMEKYIFHNQPSNELGSRTFVRGRIIQGFHTGTSGKNSWSGAI